MIPKFELKIDGSNKWVQNRRLRLKITKFKRISKFGGFTPESIDFHHLKHSFFPISPQKTTNLHGNYTFPKKKCLRFAHTCRFKMCVFEAIALISNNESLSMRRTSRFWSIVLEHDLASKSFVSNHKLPQVAFAHSFPNATKIKCSETGNSMHESDLILYGFSVACTLPTHTLCIYLFDEKALKDELKPHYFLGDLWRFPFFHTRAPQIRKAFFERCPLLCCGSILRKNRKKRRTGVWDVLIKGEFFFYWKIGIEACSRDGILDSLKQSDNFFYFSTLFLYRSAQKSSF